jgi:serine/threonine protein kinase
MGTARWAAPEQLMFGVISKASDVYSFGMTAFEVFTGKAPFAHTPDTLLLNLVVDRKLRPPRPSEDEAPSLDNATWTFVGACWVDEQSARPSATQIEAALKRRRSASAVPTPSSLPAVAPVEEPSPVLVDPNKPPDGHLLTPPGTPPLPLTYHPFVSPHRDCTCMNISSHVLCPLNPALSRDGFGGDSKFACRTLDGHELCCA